MMKYVPAYQIAAGKQISQGISMCSSVADAIRMMIQNQVEALPVFRDTDLHTTLFAPTEWHNDFVLVAQDEFGPFIGVIDAQDIAAFAAFYLDNPGFEHIDKAFESIMVQDMVGCYEKLMNSQVYNGLFVVSPTCPVEQLVDLFMGKIRRVFVSTFTKNDVPKDFSLKMITSKDVLEFFMKKDPQTLELTIGNKNFADKALENPCFGTLEAVELNSTVRSALQTLMYSRAEAVAIVNPKGVLVRDLSAKDVLAMFTHIKGLRAVLDFSVEQYFSDTEAKIMTANSEDFVVPILRKLEITQFDRTWIVDPSNRPISCIGLESFDRLISSLRNFDY